jgi:two-component system NtrC family sensor kinase
MITFSRHSLRFKLFLTLSLLILVIVASLSSFYAVHEIQGYKLRTAEKARFLASSLANSARLPLFADDREALARLVTETSGYTGVGAVTIFSASGDVVARSGKPMPQTAVNSINREAFVLSNVPGNVVEDRLGPAPENGAPLGRVRVTMADTELRAFIRSLVVTTTLMVFLFWIAGTALSYLLARLFTRSLTPLVSGLKVMRRGDYTVRIDTVGNNELAESSALINDLAEALQQRAAENAPAGSGNVPEPHADHPGQPADDGLAEGLRGAPPDGQPGICRGCRYITGRYHRSDRPGHLAAGTGRNVPG